MNVLVTLLMVGSPSSIPFERLQEGGARLIRWVHEHIVIEEERLFPGLPGVSFVPK